MSELTPEMILTAIKEEAEGLLLPPFTFDIYSPKTERGKTYKLTMSFNGAPIASVAEYVRDWGLIFSSSQGSQRMQRFHALEDEDGITLALKKRLKKIISWFIKDRAAFASDGPTVLALSKIRDAGLGF